jgi:hypothetical protein
VWRRQHSFDFRGTRYCQTEQYFIVHAARFDPKMSDTVEAAVVDRFRWWKTSELHHASERLTPSSLASILERYLRDGAPKEVPDIEILVD